MPDSLPDLEVPKPRYQSRTLSKLPRSNMLVLGGLFVVLASLTLMLYLPHRAVHSDNQNFVKAQNAANKMSTFIVDKAKIPTDLHEVGVTGPAAKGLGYHKNSATSYTFCVTYAHEGVSQYEDTGSIPIIGGFGGYSNYTGDNYTSKTDLVIPSKHAAGKNCQTITPNIAPIQPPIKSVSPPTTPDENAKASGAQDTVCSLSGYATHYWGTVKSVRTADGKPIVPTVKSSLIITVDAQGTGKTGIQTITIGDSFNVFNTACTAMTHESLQVGDIISVFQDNTNQYMPPAIVDFSRNY